MSGMQGTKRAAEPNPSSFYSSSSESHTAHGDADNGGVEHSVEHDLGLADMTQFLALDEESNR